MSYLIKEIKAHNLKPYVSSMKACRITNNFELAGKFGNAVFDFSEYANADRIVINIKRDSGNGLVATISGSNVLERSIASKTGQHMNLKLADHKKLEIKRPNRSNGNVQVMSIQLYSDAPGRVYTGKDWREILDDCTDYKFVRVVDNKLFASEGAMIKTSGINAVNTNPPHMYRINNNTIRFAGSCEIIDLDINRDLAKVEAKAKLLYHHFDIEPPNVQTEPGLKRGENLRPLTRKRADHITPIDSKINILYDSKSQGFRKENIVRGSIVTGDSVRMASQDALLFFPLDKAEPNLDYIISLDIKKITGNGKITAKITNNDDIKRKSVTETSYQTLKTLRFILNSGTKGKNKNYGLEMTRPLSATGDVVISRIMVLESLMPAKQAIIELVRRSFDHSGLAEENAFRVKSFNEDVVLDYLKGYAVHYSDFTAEEMFDNISGFMKATTSSGASWLSKIKPLFPNVGMHRGNNGGKDALLIGSVGALHHAKCIYLDEFEKYEFSKQEMDVLERSEKIFSSSKENIEELKELFPNVDVHFSCRIWPFVDPKPVTFPAPKSYILMPNRLQPMEKIFNSHTNDLPKIFLLGGRGRYPKFVLPSHEYIHYPSLLWIILQAKCIVDMPDMTYTSSMLTMAHDMGVPIVTSNKTMEGKKNVFIIDNDDEAEAINATLKEAIGIETKRKALPMQNKALMDIIMFMLS